MIKLLSTHPEAGGFKFHKAKADADRLIVTKATDIRDSGQESVLVVDDSDLALLIAFASPHTNIKIMIPANKAHPDEVFSSKRIRSEMCSMIGSLLFLHAITGCETTSAVYGKGKKLHYKELREDPALGLKKQVVSDPQVSADDVTVAG